MPPQRRVEPLPPTAALDDVFESTHVLPLANLSRSRLHRPGTFRVARRRELDQAPSVRGWACGWGGVRSSLVSSASFLCYIILMLGFGLGEVVLLILVIFGVWASYRLFTRTTWIERLVARVAQRRFAALPPQPDAVREREARIVPFPRSVAALLVGAAVVVAFASAGKLFVRVSYGSVSIFWLEMIWRLTCWVLPVAAVILHWSGSQIRRRRMKYELMSGSMGFALFGGLVDMLAKWQLLNKDYSGFAFEDVFVRVDWQGMCWLFAAPLLVLTLGAISYLIVKRVSIAGGGYRRAIHLHRWITPVAQMVILFIMILSLGRILAAFVPLIGGVMFLFIYLYLFVRFELKQLLLTRPILYLRSFHSDAAALAFARIVVPVASRYGVLAGLVHSVQPAHVLQQRVPTLDRGSFVEVSDERWREWVKHALASCHLVIIDVSNPTDSVKWELKTAMDMIGPQRIVLLEHKEDLGESVVWQADWIYYSRDSRWTKRTRLALARWFATAVNAPLSATTPATATSIAVPSSASVSH